MITEKKESEIFNQKNENNHSKNDKTNENSINGNGLITIESKSENNNEKIIEINKRNGSQNIIENKSHESELHTGSNFDTNSQLKKENKENNIINRQNDSEVEIIRKPNTVLNYLKNIIVIETNFVFQSLEE